MVSKISHTKQNPQDQVRASEAAEKSADAALKSMRRAARERAAASEAKAHAGGFTCRFCITGKSTPSQQNPAPAAAQASPAAAQPAHRPSLAERMKARAEAAAKAQQANPGTSCQSNFQQV